MELPEGFRGYGTALLTEHPQIKHEWSLNADYCKLFIPGSNPNGFDISFVIETHAATLNWGNWHTPYEPIGRPDEFIQDLFGLLRDMLSPDMRIQEFVAGRNPYRGFLQFYDGTHWSTEQEMGLFLWNYLGKRSVGTYSNSIPQQTNCD